MEVNRKAVAAACLALAGGTALGACSASTGNAAPNTTIGPAAKNALGTYSAAGDGSFAQPHTISQPSPNGQLGSNVTVTQPLIVRTGYVTIEDNKTIISKVFDEVSADANKLKGFVSSSSTSSAGDAGGATLVVRVPSDQFGMLVFEVGNLGKVQSQSETGQDVTGESIDMQARLANLESEEAALRALVEKATTVSAILDVQNQLFNVEGEIEQLTAQENSLVNQATYATLTVTIEPAPARHVLPARPNAVNRAFKTALHNTAVAARSVVYALGWAFPGLVLLVIGLFAVRFARRSRRLQPAVAAAAGSSSPGGTGSPGDAAD
jgi:hypothetical protein